MKKRRGVEFERFMWWRYVWEERGGACSGRLLGESGGGGVMQGVGRFM